MYGIRNSSGKYDWRIENGENRIGTQARYILNIKNQSESFNYFCRKNKILYILETKYGLNLNINYTEIAN